LQDSRILGIPVPGETSNQPFPFPSKKLGAMQPYFFPYLGYFQLIKAVNVFVVLNRVQYTKRGWINRNYLLDDHQRPKRFTLSIQKGGQKEAIQARKIVPGPKNKDKILNALRQAYRKAPQYDQVMPGLAEAIGREEIRLDRYLFSCIQFVCRYLGLSTRIVLESDVAYPAVEGRANRLIALSSFFQAGEYVNPMGGKGLYSPEEFEEQGLRLTFLQSKPVGYAQFSSPFVPNLSIIDVLMFNSRDQVSWLLDQYDLLAPEKQVSEK
jgi:hypothetical protein